MKYYLLNWEEKGNPVPRIRNWMERLDYQAVQRRELAKLPERTIFFLVGTSYIFLTHPKTFLTPEKTVFLSHQKTVYPNFLPKKEWFAPVTSPILFFELPDNPVSPSSFGSSAPDFPFPPSLTDNTSFLCLPHYDHSFSHVFSKNHMHTVIHDLPEGRSDFTEDLRHDLLQKLCQ